MMKKSELLKDPIFISIFCFGLILVITFSLIIFVTNNLTLGFYWTPKNLSDFFSLFDLPIKTATATLALLGFWAVVFRSLQTKQQMDIMINQNTYTNYVTHKREFMKMLIAIEEAHKLKFSEKELLYSMLFPENSPTKPIEINSSSEVLKVIVQIYNDVIDKLSEYLKSETPENRKLEKTLLLFMNIPQTLYIEFEEAANIHKNSVKEFYKQCDNESEKRALILRKIPPNVYLISKTTYRVLSTIIQYCSPDLTYKFKLNDLENSNSLDSLDTQISSLTEGTNYE